MYNTHNHTQNIMTGPSYHLSMCTKWPLNPSIEIDPLSCSQGVQNREVSLYNVSHRIMESAKLEEGEGEEFSDFHVSIYYLPNVHVFGLRTGRCPLSRLSPVHLVAPQLSWSTAEAHTGVCREPHLLIRTVYSVQPDVGPAPPWTLAR